MTLSEPQVWVLVATFSAGVLGTLGFTMSLMTRTLKSEIAALRGDVLALDGRLTGEIAAVRSGLGGEIAAVRSGLGGEIAAVRSELGGEISAIRSDVARVEGVMNARFDSLEHRVDGLDRDVAAVTKRLMGDGGS